MKRFILLLTALILLPLIEVAAQCKVTVTVEGLRLSKGKVFVALQNSEKLFKSNDTYYKGLVIDIDKKESSCTFQDIPKGTYAVALFHDENGDGKPNFNFMGLPKEGFGFSNNAMGVMSKPSFKAASFEVTPDKTAKQKIKMRYIL